MAISLSKYVNITSAVGAGNSVNTKQLIGRFFTANILLAPQSFLQFTSAADVGLYFGTNSEEYYRALFYFSWVSKNILSPPAIQFARWVNNAVAPSIYSIPNQIANSVATWNGLVTASFGLTIGTQSNVFNFTSSAFSGAVTYADIATIIQTAVQAGTGSQFTTATVTAVGSGFVFNGGVAAGNSAISVQRGTSGTDISQYGYLGWLPGNPYVANIFSAAIYNNNSLWLPGSAVETLTATLNSSIGISDNFGSFAFLNNLGLNLTQVEEIATWNASAAQNNDFLYSVPVIAANFSTWTTGLAGFGGTSTTLTQTNLVLTGTLASTSPIVTGLANATSVLQVGMPVSDGGVDIPVGTVIVSITNDTTIVLSNSATGSTTEALTFSTVQFPEQAPMMIAAATNYNTNNGVQNYMFQNFDPFLTPLVNDTSTSNAYDAVALNYYGQTQTAGQTFNFYQRGLMQGGANDPRDQNTYVNEIWLKSELAAQLLGLLLNLNEVPANTQGQALALLVIQGVINQALLNGVISVGKPLTTAQQVFITTTTGDANAWYQVQNSGYWVNVVIQQIPDLMPIQYEAAYTLIYSKNDVIRFISGTDILI